MIKHALPNLSRFVQAPLLVIFLPLLEKGDLERTYKPSELYRSEPIWSQYPLTQFRTCYRNARLEFSYSLARSRGCMYYLLCKCLFTSLFQVANIRFSTAARVNKEIYSRIIRPSRSPTRRMSGGSTNDCTSRALHALEGAPSASDVPEHRVTPSVQPTQDAADDGIERNSFAEVETAADKDSSPFQALWYCPIDVLFFWSDPTSMAKIFTVAFIPPYVVEADIIRVHVDESGTSVDIRLMWPPVMLDSVAAIIAGFTTGLRKIFLLNTFVRSDMRKPFARYILSLILNQVHF